MRRHPNLRYLRYINYTSESSGVGNHLFHEKLKFYLNAKNAI